MKVLLIIGLVVAGLIGVFFLYLCVVAVVPGFSVPRQPLTPAKPQSEVPETPAAGVRKDVCFEVQGTPVSAWLYLPEDRSGPVPCIVMASGAGGTRDTAVEPYARRFREAGFAVLLFDYRHFGASGGEPRQLLWIPYQLEDYAAAIVYARGLKEIDPAKIALWGTSLSGGHVIVLAAKDARIACVAAQCPGLDGRAAGEMHLKRTGLRFIIRMMMHGQRDLVRSWFGLSPHKIPIVGRPGTVAMMTTPGAVEAFEKLVPEGFVNEVCARILIRGDKYRPVKHAGQVRCPVLLQVCDRDDLAPPSAAEETARRLGDLAEVVHYPIGHFDVYLGEAFERSVSDQLAFFRKHLGS